MATTLDAAILDATQCVWHGEEDDVVDVIVPNPQDKAQRILRNVLRIMRWEDARRIATHIASREGFASDSMTFRYPNFNAEPSPYTHFDGVTLFDAGQEPLLVPEAALDRLIARLLSLLISNAVASDASVLQTDWWHQLTEDANTIISRSQ